MRTTYKYLNISYFSQTLLWNVSDIHSGIIKYKFPVQKLNSVLSEANIKWISIEDNKQYPILGVHAQGEGVYINKVVYGKELTMKRYQKSKINTLFYCKVRTVNGQWGIVYPQYENSYGSSNMQYLDIDYNKILPEYLLCLLKSKRITQEWDKNAIGADKRHFSLSTLLNLKIPLPLLCEQKKLVSDYNRKIQNATTYDLRFSQTEQNIQIYLNDVLGIKFSKNNTKKFLAISFAVLNRWDSDGFIPKDDFVTKYHFSTLDECLDCFMTDSDGKSLRLETNKTPEDMYSYIGMENIEKETGILAEFQCVRGKEIKSQTIRVPKNYFLYGKLRPYLNKYWYNESDDTNIVCSSEFFVFSIKKTINPYYFKFYISSNSVQKQIENLFQGARMPRINENTFKSIKIPLPPIEVQNEIATHIFELKTQINDFKQKAIKLRNSALEDFENEIFE